MSASVQVTGLARARKKLLRSGVASDIAVTSIINRIATRTVDRIEEGMMQSPSSGKTYIRANPYRIHTASAPGKYPRVDTHRLLSSLIIDWATRTNKFSSVGSNLPYAEDLEHGTANMLPRPWLFRSYRSATRTIGRELRKEYEALR